MVWKLMKTDWGGALIDINKYAPKESADIKNAIKRALNSINKEFDEL